MHLRCFLSAYALAPMFSQRLKLVKGHLRSQGFLSVDYIDDILLIGKTYEECYTYVQETKALLELLGFLLNERKCILIPSQQCRFLGFEIDSLTNTISLPEEKKLKILNLIKSMVRASKVQIRDFAHLIGKLVAACPGV